MRTKKILFLIVATILMLMVLSNSKERIDTVSAVTTNYQSTNNYLSSLTSNVVEINFNSYKYSYYVTVDNNINTINLKATTSDSKATASIYGDTGFVVGSNTITIKVISESGSSRYYYVYVTKKDVVKSTNNYLSNLYVENQEISPAFDKTRTLYSFTINDSTINKLNINYITEDPKAKAVIIGNDNLVVGDNTITITVTAESGDKKIYTIIATKKDQQVITSDDNNSNSIMIYVLSGVGILFFAYVSFILLKKKSK